MTKTIKSGRARSASARRVRSKLVERSSGSSYVSLSTRKHALETKLRELREDTRNSTVEVIGES